MFEEGQEGARSRKDGQTSSPSQVTPTCNSSGSSPSPRGSGAGLHVRQLPHLPPGDLDPAGHLPPEKEVSLEATCPSGHQAVSPSAAVWAPSRLSEGGAGGGGDCGGDAVKSQGPKEGWVGIGKVLYLHCFQAPPLSPRLTSSPILKSHSAPQFQGTRVRQRCGTRRRFRATPGHKAFCSCWKRFPSGRKSFPPSIAPGF